MVCPKTGADSRSASENFQKVLRFHHIFSKKTAFSPLAGDAYPTHWMGRSWQFLRVRRRLPRSLLRGQWNAMTLPPTSKSARMACVGDAVRADHPGFDAHRFDPVQISRRSGAHPPQFVRIGATSARSLDTSPVDVAGAPGARLGVWQKCARAAVTIILPAARFSVRLV
jgi:hypothetical protein